MRILVHKLKVNFKSLGYSEVIDGVNYQVYPVTMLVEGVHHGAIGGPTYYPASALQDTASEWNGVFIPINHPQDAAGNYISANSDGVQNFGFIRNTFYENGKLKAEACINLNLVDSSIITDIEKGSMEVSTGLYAEIKDRVGTWNQEEYEAIVESIVPDHLALLPDTTGACSVNDGCGIRPHDSYQQPPLHEGLKHDELPAILQFGDRRNVMGEDKKLPIDVNKESEEYLNQIDNLDSYRKSLLHKKLLNNSTSFNDIQRQLSDYVDSMDVARLNENGPYKINYLKDVYRNFFIFKQETENGSRLYKQSYTEDNGRVIVDPVMIEVYKKTEYLPVQSLQGNNREEKQMSDKPCCPEKVRALIANSNTTFTDKDEGWLSTLTEDQLGHFETLTETAVNAMENVKLLEANNANKPATVQEYLAAAPEGIKQVLNEGLKQLDKIRADHIKTILANESNKFTEDQLKTLDNTTLENISALSVKALGPEEQGYIGAYIGQGGGGNRVNTVKEEAYVPQTLNFGN